MSHPYLCEGCVYRKKCKQMDFKVPLKKYFGTSVLATLNRRHTISSGVLQRRRPFNFKDPSLQAHPLSMALCCWAIGGKECYITLQVDFATAASQDGFQCILNKLPFIRKTKIFRKTKNIEKFITFVLKQDYYMTHLLSLCKHHFVMQPFQKSTVM
jgi:hypothetical protein